MQILFSCISFKEILTVSVLVLRVFPDFIVSWKIWSNNVDGHSRDAGKKLMV